MQKEILQKLKKFKKIYDVHKNKFQEMDKNIPIYIRGFRQIDLQILGNQLLENKLDDNSSFLDITSKDLQTTLTVSFEDITSNITGTITTQSNQNDAFQIQKYNNDQNLLLWPCYKINQEIDQDQFLVNSINQCFAKKIYQKSKKAKIIMLIDAQNKNDNYLINVQNALQNMFQNTQNYNQSKDSILLYLCNIQTDQDLKDLQQKIQDNKELSDIKQVQYKNFINDLNDEEGIKIIKDAIQNLNFTQEIYFENLEGNFNKVLNEYYDQIKTFISEYYQCGNKEEESKYLIEINEIEITKSCMLLLSILKDFNVERAEQIYKQQCKIFQEHYQDFKNFINQQIKDEEMDEDSYQDIYEDYLKEFVLNIQIYLENFKMKKDLINFDKQIRQNNFNTQIEYSFDDNTSTNSQEEETNIIPKNNSFENKNYKKCDDGKQDLISDHKENWDSDKKIIINKEEEVIEDKQNVEIDFNDRAQVENLFQQKTNEQDRYNHQNTQLENCYQICQQIINDHGDQQNLKQILRNNLNILQIQYYNDFQKLKNLLKEKLEKVNQKQIKVKKECIQLYLQHKKILLNQQQQKQEQRVNKILQKYKHKLQQYDEITQKKKQIQKNPQKQLFQIIATTQNVQEFKKICNLLIQQKQNINEIIDDQIHSLLYNSILFESKEIQNLLENQYKVQFNKQDQKSINQNFCEAINRFEFDAILVKIFLGHNIDEHFNCLDFEFNPSLIKPCEVTEEIDDLIDPLLNMISYEDLNALDVAILQNNFQAIKIIVEKGNCKLNNENRKDKLVTPLMIAILTGNQEIFDYLYEKCDKNIKSNQNNFNLAHMAIHSNNLEVLQKLNQNYFKEQDNDGYIPLHLAIQINLDYDVFMEILKKTENLNILNNENQSALTMAILYYDQLNLIKYIDYDELCLQWNSKSEKEIEDCYFDEMDLNKQLYYTETKLDVILNYCKKNRTKKLDLFQKQDQQLINFDYAILKGETIVNKLIKFDKEFNNKLTEQQKFRYTNSRENFVKSFFRNSKIQRQINSGQLKEYFFKIIFDLYKENIGEFTIDKDIQDEQGNTLLHYLVEESMTKTIQEKLLKNSEILEKKNNLGETPLIIAVTLQNKECMKLLIDKGSDINCFNYENQTPLMISIKDECFESAEFLLKQPQIDKSLKDKYDKTAKDYLDLILDEQYECMRENSKIKAQNLKTKF